MKLHSRKVALVTGGTDGIGKEIARRLAGLGAAVGLVGRDARKGEEAIEELRWSSGNPGADFLRADLSLMTECDRLAVEVQARWPRLH